MDVCDEFEKNPAYNPLTNRKIAKTGAIYKDLVRSCKELKDRRILQNLHKINRLNQRYVMSFNDHLYNRLLAVDYHSQLVERRSSRQELLDTNKIIPIEMLLKEALDRGYINNVLYFKNIKIIKKCEQYEFKGVCKSYSRENYDGTLESIEDELTEELLINIIQQLMLCLAVLQGKYGIVHLNINKYTVVYKKVDATATFRYIIRNREFYVPNLGYIFLLDNFSEARVYNPKYSNTNFYGTRNAKIIIDDQKLAVWGEETANNSVRINFKTKYTPIFDNWAKIVGLTLNKTTDNKFCHLDIKPDITVDLTNMCKFPVWENILDIESILNLVTDYISYDDDTEDVPLWYQKALEVVGYKGHYTTLGNLYDEMIFPDVLIANLFPELKFKTKFVDTYKWP
ncbi:hypothetical protein LCDV1gp050 [Lymphocystis disease virus 1]|uniref:hypothetical protein n=1 Tax=Fish lymphocystis disease virus TaxID=36363 RepID=UPI0000161EB5|nr:hypothetical protein LCDV1gp050 [Lymphocystis disease virus 1]